MSVGDEAPALVLRLTPKATVASNQSGLGVGGIGETAGEEKGLMSLRACWKLGCVDLSSARPAL